MRPLRKLRKILKEIPALPTPEQVHELRAETRRLEAMVHALSPPDEKTALRLLELMKPVRKAAGAVRDMDVLIGKLFMVNDDSGGDGLVRLEEHLAEQRLKCAKRLHRAVRAGKSKARRWLKRYAGRLEDSLVGAHDEGLAAAQIMAVQLKHWPELRAENLHAFRIQAKELRHMMQLLGQADRRTMDAFAHVKDAAGDWHDWLELRHAAEDVLDAEGDQRLLKQIAAKERAKLRTALMAANALRRSGLGAGKGV